MPRELYAVRLNPEAVAQVDEIARDEGRTRSDVIRRLLSEALAARAKRKH
jgi:metal-responsive CopG/Arc/MetJ family transcriptional regulator